jgi:hypothetical protein
LFLEIVTWAMNSGGEAYERFNTIFAGGLEGGPVLSFAFDGSVSQGHRTPVESAESPSILILGGSEATAELEQPRRQSRNQIDRHPRCVVGAHEVTQRRMSLFRRSW